MKESPISDRAEQTLLIDADDTLWENNIYFERVIAEVQEILSGFFVPAVEFRNHLNNLERKHIRQYGYGTLNFTRSLVQAFEECIPCGVDGNLAPRIEALGLGLLDHPIELLDGVHETLEYLSRRHSLCLVTKGDSVEQLRKIDASGLKERFETIEIVSEKNRDTYRWLVASHRWDPSRTWMVGNSPRSDINPAVAAGLRAVFIPHPHTWVLEHEDPVEDPRVIKLERFSDLQLHF